jgi:hypothetical protein
MPPFGHDVLVASRDAPVESTRIVAGWQFWDLWPNEAVTEDGMGLSAKSLFGETPVRVSVDLLENLLAAYPRRDFQVRLWDGSIWVGGEQPRFTLVLKHPGALRAMFLSPSEFTLGEAYIYDDFDIEGEIVLLLIWPTTCLGKNAACPSVCTLPSCCGNPPQTIAGDQAHNRPIWGVRFTPRSGTDKPSAITTIFPPSFTPSGWIRARFCSSGSPYLESGAIVASETV